MVFIHVSFRWFDGKMNFAVFGDFKCQNLYVYVYPKRIDNKIGKIKNLNVVCQSRCAGSFNCMHLKWVVARTVQGMCIKIMYKKNQTCVVFKGCVYRVGCAYVYL